MTRRKPVWVIRQPSNYGSRDEYGLEFICCVGGREPQTHELWSFAEDRITRKVHPFAQIYIDNFSGDSFQTAYATEIGRRMSIYFWKSMNGSVEWLGVPAPSCGTGVAWTEISWFLITMGIWIWLRMLGFRNSLYSWFQRNKRFMAWRSPFLSQLRSQLHAPARETSGTGSSSLARPSPRRWRAG